MGNLSVREWAEREETARGLDAATASEHGWAIAKARTIGLDTTGLEFDGAGRPVIVSVNGKNTLKKARR